MKRERHDIMVLKGMGRIVTCLAALFVALASYGAPKISGVPHLRWGTDKVTVYQNEPATLILYLWVPEVDVRNVREIRPSSLDKGDFGFVSHADFNRTPQRKIVEDQEWLAYPIDSYVVTLEHPGKYKLNGGRYEVELAVPTIIEDPFWGKMQAYRPERTEVPVEPLNFEVKELPHENEDDNFSGAVGNFGVEVVVPPGDIYVGEEATAIVTVKGPGWINDHILPDYRDAFGNETKLKSMSETREKYLDNGKLISEIQMECTFIPTSLENAEIGPVSIRYFNPATGKYVTSSSSNVKVKVMSIAEKSPAHDI